MGFLLIICCFILGHIVFNKRVTDRVLLRWGTPRRMIIPLRTLLSSILFGSTIVLFNNEDIPNFVGIIYIIVLFLMPFFNLILTFVVIAKVYDNQEKNWRNWWQTIVYAFMFTLLIWLFSREGFDFSGSGGIGTFAFTGFPLLLFNIMFWRFITLYLSCKEKNNFKPIRYCLCSFLVLACLYFSLGGFRNTKRNYTIEESKKAETFLWEYDVCRMSKHIPEALQLPIKYAYAERDFYGFKYDNDFSNKRIPEFYNKSYCINILFDKNFNDHNDFSIKNPFHVSHGFWDNFRYREHMYQLSWKIDSIPPPDTVTFCFNYSLKYDNSTTIADTLLLIKKDQSPNQQQRK